MRVLCLYYRQGPLLTPIKTVEELLACRPARMEPMPGKNMLKMKQQMPVALGTEGTWPYKGTRNKDAQVSLAVAPNCANLPCSRLAPRRPRNMQGAFSHACRSLSGLAHAPSRTQTAANRTVERSTQYLLLAQVHAGILAELHLAPEYNGCGRCSALSQLAHAPCLSAQTPS